ncbi:MAG: N-acetylglucosamine-6-phosphate deacetylase [Ruegeria sp.]|uniref:N-acetylglucosamine-6-phosphate deacetylase n=1 Tax=Ruegeria sp. TaxID=1879320 RepID=UPI00349ECAF7
MKDALKAITGADILTPDGVRPECALLYRADRIEAVMPEAEMPADTRITHLDGGMLAPGFVDLQVNGGGGVMFNNAPELSTLRRMAEAHAHIGATSILPTLITDTPDVVSRAIDATVQAISEGVAGIAGLHLEGPHLSHKRKGAHDDTLIRPMEDADLTQLLDAAERLPVLKVTVAPESVSPAQIEALKEAGVLVSLGHTDATFEDCQAAVSAGARCVTHLFNAQSQMGNREPGVVGAVLALGELSAGLIADGIHVHAASLRNALCAKAGPGRIFLVSDAMATAGSDIATFRLNSREIRRRGDRLTLTDGTLAGAHLELISAVHNVAGMADLPIEAALDMATRIPADLIGQSHLGRLEPGAQADFLHLCQSKDLLRVWQLGEVRFAAGGASHH